METHARYRAFLSYSQTDERAARQLHRALEQFPARALPPDMRTARARPLRPVFRDRDELSASGDLSDTLRQALLSSDALVVICSPRSAASRWVNEEVATYKRTGRGDRVFAVIVDGDPSLPEHCFPPALLAEYDLNGEPTGRTIEPLAVDFRTEPRLARLRLIAALLGVDFDRLRQRDAIVRRNRIIARAATTVTIIATTMTATYFATRPAPCLDAASLTADMWNSEQASRIAEAFAATGQPYANDAWTFIETRLRSYAAAWASQHVDACEATRVRKVQSERLQDLRMECLDNARRGFDALAAELGTADAAVVERAVQGLDLLAPLPQCADRERLEARYPPPQDPALAARVDDLRVVLAEARAALAAGRLAAARDAAEHLVGDANLTRYPPLQAAALLLRADAERDMDEFDRARDTYFEAAAKAVLARDPEAAAAAWLGLPLALARGAAEFEEALRLARLAESYLTQLDPAHPLVAYFHFTVGTVHVLAGAFANGITELRRSVALARDHGDAQLAEYIGGLSWALTSVNETTEARALANESVELTGRLFGTRHPRYAKALSDLSRTEMRLGETADAVRHLQQAVAIYEAIYPDGHGILVTAMEQLAWLLKENGRYDDARATALRALALLAGMEQSNWTLSGSVYNTLGDIHLDLAELDAARQAFERALSEWSNLGDHPNVTIALGNLGNLDNREGKHVDALRRCEEALRRDEAWYGRDNPQLAYSLSCVGEAATGLGRIDDAIAALERAYRLRDRPDIDPGRRAWSGWLLGKALWHAGDLEQAKAYIAAARVGIAALEDARAELEEIDAWLTGHGLQSPD